MFYVTRNTELFWPKLLEKVHLNFLVVKKSSAVKDNMRISRLEPELLVRVLTLETETGDVDDFPDDNYSTVWLICFQFQIVPSHVNWSRKHDRDPNNS